MRYPTRNGLIVPPSELGFETVPHKRRETSNHHAYFNRAEYRDVSYRRIFRGLVTNVFTLSIYDHQELHEVYSPPVMPKDIQMIDVVEEYLASNGVIDVVREKRTCNTYQIESDTWQNIKSQYGSGHGIQQVYANGNSTTHQFAR